MGGVVGQIPWHQQGALSTAHFLTVEGILGRRIDSTAGVEDGRLAVVVQLHLLHDRPVTSRNREEGLAYHEAGG